MQNLPAERVCGGRRMLGGRWGVGVVAVEIGLNELGEMERRCGHRHCRTFQKMQGRERRCPFLIRQVRQG